MTQPLARVLTVGTVIRVGDVERSIRRRAGTDRSPIVAVDGITDRDGVQGLRSAQLAIAIERLPALGPGEWWAHELAGLSVSDGERQIGRVVRMVELPTCEALLVQLVAGSEIVVPLVQDAIRSVDVAGGSVVIDAGFMSED